MSNTDKEKLSLSTPISDLENRLLTEQNSEEIKNIVDLFNLNILKKNIIRTNRLNELQDKVYNQIEKRLDKHADEFSNKDLLDYFKVILDTVDKTDTGIDNLRIPAILINLQNINISDTLDSDSKKRVSQAVRAILKKYKNLDINLLNEEIISKEEIIDGL